MFGFSGEHLLVLLVILLIFGPKRLPDLGHSLGRTLKNFKDAMAGQNAANEAQQPVPPAQQIPPQSAQAAPANPAAASAPEPQKTEQA
jgi:sec-independent protein translocase protein TatA